MLSCSSSSGVSGAAGIQGSSIVGPFQSRQLLGSRKAKGGVGRLFPGKNKPGGAGSVAAGVSVAVAAAATSCGTSSLGGSGGGGEPNRGSHPFPLAKSPKERMTKKKKGGRDATMLETEEKWLEK